MRQSVLKKIALIIGFIIGYIAGCLSLHMARAEINYNLLFNWSLQPQNVQQNLVKQVTTIRVVDDIPFMALRPCIVCPERLM